MQKPIKSVRTLEPAPINHNETVDGNLIQKLFPDRAIKAQNFIDLLSSKNQKTAYRVQDPLARRANDLALAVKELVSNLKDRFGVHIELRREPGKDPMIYALSLPGGRVQTIRPHTAHYGIPGVKDNTLRTRVKLSLSGGMLMVQRGGGYQDILEFLEKKGYLAGCQQLSL